MPPGGARLPPCSAGGSSVGGFGFVSGIVICGATMGAGCTPPGGVPGGTMARASPGFACGALAWAATLKGKAPINKLRARSR